MLNLRNICFDVFDESTGEKKQILKNVNLCVKPGDFVVITGPNGSGKSTLAKTIMGMDIPTSGSIYWNARDITDLDITERAEAGIGFAFQQPIRFKGLMVEDLLRFASGKELSLEEACDYLSQVGLCAKDYIGRELNESLSGGEAKRIEIAMLMARNVQLSIFDEPEAGIDLWSFHKLIDVFEKLQTETKGSIIIISHQERILEIANRIVVIADGEITAEGDAKEILPGLLIDDETCEFYRKKV